VTRQYVTIGIHDYGDVYIWGTGGIGLGNPVYTQGPRFSRCSRIYFIKIKKVQAEEKRVGGGLR